MTKVHPVYVDILIEIKIVLDNWLCVFFYINSNGILFFLLEHFYLFGNKKRYSKSRIIRTRLRKRRSKSFGSTHYTVLIFEYIQMYSQYMKLRVYVYINKSASQCNSLMMMEWSLNYSGNVVTRSNIRYNPDVIKKLIELWTDNY